jgi:hypothetical protein
VYERELNEFKDRQEKAARDILAHLSRSQRTHVADCHNGPAEMWEKIRNMHVQQVPGMRFSAYNDPFLIVKGPEETLPAVAFVGVGACGSMDSAWTGAPVACICVLSNFVARDSSPST